MIYNLLRYPGGKNRAISKFETILSENNLINKSTVIYSPFFGGGSFEIYMSNKYNLKVHGNDVLFNLINFWKHVKLYPKILKDKISKYDKPISKELFVKLKKDLKNESNLNKAIYFYLLNRNSFNGCTLSSGYSGCKYNFTQKGVDKIKEINLSNLTFYNLDYKDFLLKMKIKDNSFIYMDPPYKIERTNLYGKNGDTHSKFNHLDFFNFINSKFKDIKWMICYNDCEYIRNLYKDYKIISVNWQYSMTNTSGARVSSEIVILNK